MDQSIAVQHHLSAAGDPDGHGRNPADVSRHMPIDGANNPIGLRCSGGQLAGAPLDAAGVHAPAPA